QMPLKPGSTTDRFVLAPVNEPRLVTDFEQFKKQFGDIQSGNSILAHSVYGFFNNGGTRCWVVRVADLTDAALLTAALKKLEVIDEIAIVAAPGALSADAQLAVIEHCENMKDRFAVIDGQRTTTIDVGSIQTVR